MRWKGRDPRWGDNRLDGLRIGGCRWDDCRCVVVAVAGCCRYLEMLEMANSSDWENSLVEERIEGCR